MKILFYITIIIFLFFTLNAQENTQKKGNDKNDDTKIEKMTESNNNLDGLKKVPVYKVEKTGDRDAKKKKAMRSAKKSGPPMIIVEKPVTKSESPPKEKLKEALNDSEIIIPAKK